jgi:formamidopyrimidine-DNA glycosylase
MTPSEGRVQDMIEMPEAVKLAGQMDQALKGRRIKRGTRGNSPHKFAFYSGSPEEYEAILNGRTVGGSTVHGGEILTSIEPDYLLVTGCGGERILLHDSEVTLPKKHQLLLEFDGGSFLSVSVQGWGAALLVKRSEADSHPLVGPRRVSPVNEEFTFERFDGLFRELQSTDPRSTKYFVISKPGVWGVGNGYLQDILYRARVHPKRRAIELTDGERRALYDAIRLTIAEAIAQGGRDTERDLYNAPGGYVRILDSRAVGRPCRECGAAIEKISFLGGASYFCPRCQV